MPDQFTEWRNNYNREKYDRCSLMLPKNAKSILQSHAAERGESLNAWINRAIKKQLEDEGAALPETSRTGD